MGTQGQDLIPELGEPFVWGQTDCVCVVVRWIDRVWKTDLSKLAVGQYDNPESAYLRQKEIDPVELLRAVGYDDFAEYPARSGDCFIGRCGIMPSMGFVWKGDVWSSAESHGVFSVPLMRLHRLKMGWVLWRRLRR